jgi:hypothetical protein
VLIALQRLASEAKRLKEQARGTPSGRSRNAPAQVQQTKATFNTTAWLTSSGMNPWNSRLRRFGCGTRS